MQHLVRQDLDVAKMREAAEYVKGRHDFACFQAAGAEPGKTTVRTVSDIRITEAEVPSDSSAKDIFIDITGDGFLYNMVRIITGTLVEVGEGRREPEDLKNIIESRDRAKAGHTAPPQGLCLMKIYFQ